VFSPYYARARRLGHGVADATNHVALNLSLYGRGRKLWCMTERGRNQLSASNTELQIGPSALHWQHDSLSIDLDEVAVPWPTRLRGRLRLFPQMRLAQPHALDADARHHWRPIAPRARIEVDLSRPGLRWHGEAYLDSNYGDVPLEDDFERWDWSRASLSGRRSAVLYDVMRRGDTMHSFALHFDPKGRTQAFDAPAPVPLPHTLWRLARGTRSDAAASVQRTLEDGPFYARSLLRSQLLGEPVTAMHESLSMRRFVAPWVQAMLPFRMPRRAG
jgi:carotenoid 1,2-hydratase